MATTERTRTRTHPDLTVSRDRRPLVGADIERWRGENGLSLFLAQAALGVRSLAKYNQLCRGGTLPYTVELIVRIYEEHPFARGWEKYSLRELFDEMYGDVLRSFRGSPFEREARIDLESRYCRLLGRSPGRRYEWLHGTGSAWTDDAGANWDVDTVLAKLKQVKDAPEVLDRLGSRVYLLRGIHLNELSPIPSLAVPPTRSKRGRKPAASRGQPH